MPFLPASCPHVPCSNLSTFLLSFKFFQSFFVFVLFLFLGGGLGGVGRAPLLPLGPITCFSPSPLSSPKIPVRILLQSGAMVEKGQADPDKNKILCCEIKLFLCEANAVCKTFQLVFVPPLRVFGIPDKLKLEKVGGVGIGGGGGERGRERCLDCQYIPDIVAAMLCMPVRTCLHCRLFLKQV